MWNSFLLFLKNQIPFSYFTFAASFWGYPVDKKGASRGALWCWLSLKGWLWELPRTPAASWRADRMSITATETNRPGREGQVSHSQISTYRPVAGTHFRRWRHLLAPTSCYLAPPCSFQRGLVQWREPPWSRLERWPKYVPVPSVRGNTSMGCIVLYKGAHCYRSCQANELFQKPGRSELSSQGKMDGATQDLIRRVDVQDELRAH